MSGFKEFDLELEDKQSELVIVEYTVKRESTIFSDFLIGLSIIFSIIFGGIVLGGLAFLFFKYIVVQYIIGAIGLFFIITGIGSNM
jgi:hypothetical protein